MVDIKKNHSTSNSNDIFDIQWGGYYTSKEDGTFGLFRLLDFNKDAYHIQLFREKFDHSPSFEEVKGLEPFIWHVPIAVAGLLNREEFKLIGYEALDEQSLVGYEEYLQQMGADEAEIEEMVHSLVRYSNEPPMKVQITQSADGALVTPLG